MTSVNAAPQKFVKSAIVTTSRLAVSLITILCYLAVLTFLAPGIAVNVLTHRLDGTSGNGWFYGSAADLSTWLLSGCVWLLVFFVVRRTASPKSRLLAAAVLSGVAVFYVTTLLSRQ